MFQWELLIGALHLLEYMWFFNILIEHDINLKRNRLIKFIQAI